MDIFKITTVEPIIKDGKPASLFPFDSYKCKQSPMFLKSNIFPIKTIKYCTEMPNNVYLYYQYIVSIYSK